MLVPAAVTVRAATEDDLFFLAEAIRQSDSAGTDLVSFQRLFGLNNLELQQLLMNLAGEEIEGQEYCYPNFRLVVSKDPAGQETLLGGLAAWVEGEAGLPSSLLKAQLLSFLVGSARWHEGLARMEKLATIDIPREAGTLQLDSIYLRAEARGKGLLGQLIEAVEQEFRATRPNLRKAQILLMDSNARALKAYEKLGYEAVRRTNSPDPEIPALVSGSGRVLLEKRFA